ncbi:MAG: hypothetical protein AB1589_36090 [Cyanobacteriota bacterium]
MPYIYPIITQTNLLELAQQQKRISDYFCNELPSERYGFISAVYHYQTGYQSQHRFVLKVKLALQNYQYLKKKRSLPVTPFLREAIALLYLNINYL